MIKMTFARFETATENYLGFCVTCGRSRKHCEPDAREYPCAKCKTNTVYGAEELLIIGEIELR